VLRAVDNAEKCLSSRVSKPEMKRCGWDIGVGAAIPDSGK
jgi:hypothetical protein